MIMMLPVSDSPLGIWLQSAQPSGSSSPDKVHQYCLYVVIPGVSQRHPVGPNRPCYFSQEAIPHLTGGFFQ